MIGFKQKAFDMSSLGQDDHNDENNKGKVYDKCQILVCSWKKRLVSALTKWMHRVQCKFQKT